ncbi:MAG: tRNA preQ1(34) S-adenosylmethionine ribosyltransferase-isomerase QueA [Fimbriimonadaceae bacterium]|nr:tRNA preQ1(34) S-adenosylmethionine ribosyltransferase-isomerase QueA [Fimbriimonadaceae bacterium]
MTDERLDAYDYDLPKARIAQYPLEDRAASRLLWLPRVGGQPLHRTFRDVLEILAPGDLLVLNDTRVAARRLFGHKETGARVEALLLKDLGEGRFEALVKPGRKLPDGTRVRFEQGLVAAVESHLGGGRRVLNFGAPLDPSALESASFAPLPPYIGPQLRDASRYQTVYAADGQSSAAPTAGLHFTPELLARLSAKGVEAARVRLEVGLDTFRPIQADDLAHHQMHGETCSVPEETAEAVAGCRGRIVAVGTTTVRTLESFAAGPRRLASGTMESRLFIRPGFAFRVVDGMFTNFHMPRTSMLVMLAAMVGRERLLDAYHEALNREYRFLSFGDSMLIL